MGLSVATPVTAKGEVTEEQTVENSVFPHRVAFIGLGAMGFGMASWLVHEKFTVNGYDVSIQTRSLVDYSSMTLSCLSECFFYLAANHT